MPAQKKKKESLGVPPSQFHPHRPDAPFRKRGNIKTVIAVTLLILVVDLLIYFFLIKPDDTALFNAIAPLKPR